MGKLELALLGAAYVFHGNVDPRLNLNVLRRINISRCIWTMAVLPTGTYELVSFYRLGCVWARHSLE